MQAGRQKCWQAGRLVGRQGLNDDCTMKKMCRPLAGKFLCVICVIVEFWVRLDNKGYFFHSFGVGWV